MPEFIELIREASPNLWFTSGFGNSMWGCPRREVREKKFHPLEYSLRSLRDSPVQRERKSFIPWNSPPSPHQPTTHNSLISKVLPHESRNVRSPHEGKVYNGKNSAVGSSLRYQPSPPGNPRRNRSERSWSRGTLTEENRTMPYTSLRGSPRSYLDQTWILSGSNLGYI